MLRAFLPAVCPHCGEDVPRAAARRCPICRSPFPLPFSVPEPRRLPRRKGAKGGDDGER